MPPTPADIANAAAQQGRFDDAVEILKAAGDKGDASAQAELAAWYLRGDLISRDLVKARAALRRAVEIGHVDAALLEVALAASGGGAPPDWIRAIALLRKAAINDSLAVEHLSLLDKMDLDEMGYPRTSAEGERLSEQPFIQRFPAVFSAQECLHIAKLANDRLEPAMVADPRTGRNIVNPIRTSDGTVIGPAQETLVVAALNRRLAALTGTRVEQGEPLSVLRYGPGQEYRAHVDTLPGAINQRIATAIAYLNDGFDGGETFFFANRISVTPKAGDVLVFRNLLANGTPDGSTRHAGLAVRRGTKWIATRWVRRDPYDPWTYREGA
jgi:prolyl 4-hydroxylase